MTVKITLEYANMDEAIAAMGRLDRLGNVPAAKALAEKPAPVPQVAAKAIAKAPEPTPEPAPQEPEPTEMSEADLSKVVVAAAARVGKDKVVDALQSGFGVARGKDITDPATRVKAAVVLKELV